MKSLLSAGASLLAFLYQTTEWQCIGREINTTFIFARADFVNVHQLQRRKLIFQSASAIERRWIATHGCTVIHNQPYCNPTCVPTAPINAGRHLSDQMTLEKAHELFRRLICGEGDFIPEELELKHKAEIRLLKEARKESWQKPRQPRGVVDRSVKESWLHANNDYWRYDREPDRRWPWPSKYRKGYGKGATQ